MLQTTQRTKWTLTKGSNAVSEKQSSAAAETEKRAEEAAEELCASCSAACPVLTDTRRYTQLVAEGKYEEAFEIIRATNPFPSVCARICHHPCEAECRRGKVDQAVGLRDIKRFVMEQVRDYRKQHRPTAEVTREEKIAVIGSGPGGLTVAADLANKGYAATVFEKDSVAGGMLASVIPSYRLPDEVLQEDIDDILSLGVELRLNCEVGKDVTLPDLKKQGYAAVLITTGLTESRPLGIPGTDAEGVMLALPFLRDARMGQPIELGKNVVVIGGGNVATDVARTAKRLGAPKVTMVCLESRDEMPAWEWEIEESLEEEIDIICSKGPKRIVVEDGHVVGLETTDVKSVFDEEGRFNPTFYEDRVGTIECDTIVLSIGQQANMKFTEGADVELAGPGRLVFNRLTHATSDLAIFAAGEVVTGPGAAIEAVANGHRAAEAIDHFLTHGELKEIPEEEPKPLGEIPDEVVEKIRRIERETMPTLTAEERIKDFRPIELGLTEPQALRESMRCLSCALGSRVNAEECAVCLTCVRLCPFGVATIDNTATMPAEMCQACGLCAAECPAMAIDIERFTAAQALAEVDAAVEKMGAQRPDPFLVAVCCAFEATSRAHLLTSYEDAARTGILRLTLPCVARLSVVDMLAFFEQGADGVCIIGCKAGTCRFPTADLRLRQRVARTRQLIEEAGLNADQLTMVESNGNPDEDWPRLAEEARERIATELAASAAKE